MNKIERVIATNEFMNVYCSEVTDGKRTMRSVTISRPSRRYCDLCDLLDTVTTRDQATLIKRSLFDALVQYSNTRIFSITITCFLQGCTKDVLRRMIRSYARRPQRFITVRPALSDPSDLTVTATIIKHPNQYWEIKQRFFPDLHKG